MLPVPAEWRRVRVALGVQQHEPAKKAAVSVPTLCSWEQDWSEPADVNYMRSTAALARMRKIFSD